MFELFVAMMKEEWRLHSTMFGSLSFAMFPVMIFGIAFMGAFLVPLMRTSLPAGNLTIIIHANYLMLGIMVGGFGLLGNEIMNRRFGQASLLWYSSRSLPLSERFIFTNFVVKDTIYYFFLWVLPLGLGYILASPFTAVPPASALLLLLTLTLAFLFGLCGVFFLSAVYARSRLVLLLAIAALVMFGAALAARTGMNPVLLFPPLLLNASFSWTNLLVSILVLAILSAIAILLFNPESVGSEKTYRDSFAPLAKRFSSLPDPALAAKDVLDLYRSGAMIGQMLFSFLLPLAVIWFFLSLLGPFFPPHGLLFMFAIVTGVIASTIYTWVTMFDSFGPYACLPGRGQHADHEQAHHVLGPPDPSGDLHRGRGHPRGRSRVSCPRGRARALGLVLRGRGHGLALRALPQRDGVRCKSALRVSRACGTCNHDLLSSCLRRPGICTCSRHPHYPGVVFCADGKIPVGRS